MQDPCNAATGSRAFLPFHVIVAMYRFEPAGMCKQQNVGVLTVPFVCCEHPLASPESLAVVIRSENIYSSINSNTGHVFLTRLWCKGNMVASHGSAAGKRVHGVLAAAPGSSPGERTHPYGVAYDKLGTIQRRLAFAPAQGRIFDQKRRCFGNKYVFCFRLVLLLTSPQFDCAAWHSLSSTVVRQSRCAHRACQHPCAIRNWRSYH